MPGRLAFDEAMQFPRSRLLVPDPELREGQVEMVEIKTRRGLIRRPWGLEGGFAVVYKFRTRSGQARALRCFHVDMKPDTEERYRQIATYFAAQPALQAVTVPFTYYREGIVVKEQGRGEVCPLIAMEWVEGRTLCEAVHLYCNQGNRGALRELSQRWQKLVLTMREARMAHGDLAGSNVLVREDGRLVLVDYDGVYIPPLAGYPPVLAGQEDYQHPQMRQRPFNEETDAFSALVITTALSALACDPTLWRRYARLDERGNPPESLLFIAEDFADPRNSRLFQELLSARDPFVRRLAQELRAACEQPVAQVHFPLALLDPDYERREALKRLQEAIASDDDEAIARAWLPLLEQYRPAQPELPRVELARRRLAARQRFREALSSRASLRAILASYDTVLDDSRALTPGERCLLAEGERFLQALAAQDDETLLEAAAALSQHYGLTMLSSEEQARLQAARQRQQARQAWKEARRSKEIAAVVRAYTQLQQAGLSLPPEEERLGSLATRFWTLATDPGAADEALLEAYEAIALSPLAAELRMSAEQQQRAELAERRLAALARLRMALRSRRLRAVAEADDPLLEESTALTPAERERLELARRFCAALDADDDATLVMLGEQLEEEAATSTGLLLTAEERERLELARERWRVYQRFLSALHSRQPRLIAAAAHPLLAEMQLSADERTLLELAQEFVAAYEDDRRLVAFYEHLQTARQSTFFLFSAEEQERLTALWEREKRWRLFEQALIMTPEEPGEEGPRRLLAAYNELPSALLERLTAAHQRSLTQARQALELLYLLKQDAPDEQLAAVYTPELLEAFPSLLNSVQRQRLERVLLLKELQRAWRACDYRRMLLIARTIPQPQALERYGLQLRVAARRLAEMLQLPGVLLALRPAIDGNRLIVSWRWTTDPLLRHVLVCWHTQALPPLPQPLYPGQLEQIGHYRIVSHPEPAGQGTASLNLTVGSCTLLHVVVCALLPEDWGQGANGRFVEQDGHLSDWQAADRPWWLGRALGASLALGSEVALS
ncbi:protein kinase family protein [Thermogemmatispora tikiterensis]|uniref:Protein kinase domain-containing protein n=1 Tax=Thermogemmatispora tikiterensis TaxID=1825093 RepID=A0A328VKK9_9CHLR|nr:hypothetical protein [Thermogemmatispora tikiterensis]RAQ97659.1 hypothetical protein A4R35_19125 [Thermogemmatispora tikiterensis]